MGKSMNTILLHYYNVKDRKKSKGKNMTVFQIKEEPQDEDANEFNTTLAQVKQEVPDGDGDQLDSNLTLLQIKQEPLSEDSD